MDADLFSSIFRDAHIVDIDFSQWSQRIRLCVIGVDAVFPLPERLPLFFVDFVEVLEFSCRFRHLDVKLDDPKAFFQWRVDDFEISSADGFFSITFLGSVKLPEFKVVCREVDIASLSHKVLDETFPGWDRPGLPLARPGIDELYRKRHR